MAQLLNDKVGAGRLLAVMKPHESMMRDQAERLIAEELRHDAGAGGRARAAFRVCEKLRRPLATYAGAAGFRALLSRALSLARSEQPWLRRIQIMGDGSIGHPANAEAELTTDQAAEGGMVLVTELLALMGTLIGEALTFRLVQEVWPKAAIREPKPGKK